MQELHVWGVGGLDDDFTSQNKGIVRRPASPNTLAVVRDPSLDYIHTKVPSEKRATSPPYIMSPQEKKAHDEQQAELVRRLELGLPSPEYVPKLGDNGTETWPNDIRIYTRAESGELKFWGVREDDQTMEAFWARHDPEGIRLQEPAEEVEPRDSPDHNEQIPEAAPPRSKSLVKRRQSRRKPKIKSTRRVQKPAPPPSPVNEKTRRSLGSRKDIEYQERSDHAQKDPTAASSSDRPTRTQGVVNLSERQEVSIIQKGKSKAKAPAPRPVRRSRATARTRQFTPTKSYPKAPRKAARAVEDIAALKRRPSKAPAKAKLTPVVQGNAKVTKPEKVRKPSAAPSIHTMRTRARGSPEKISIT